MKAFVISRDDLIKAKLASARPQDLADVDAIRKTAESLKPPGPKATRSPDPKKDGPKQREM